MRDTISTAVGLVKQYNPLSVRPGSLIRANNSVIRRENVIENRRGYKLLDTLLSNAKQYFSFNNRVLVHNGTSINYDDGAGDFSGSYSGSYTEPSGHKSRGIEAYSNFYFTTSSGVKVFTDFGSEARSAGAPRPLDSSYSLTSITTGFLQDGYQCAYRSLIKRVDANSNILFGYPSQRLWVANGSGNDENVVFTQYLGSEVESGDILQIYRTDQVSGTAEDTSGDEMGLVYQITVSSGDVSAGYIQFTDVVTDSLIGATLYTSPSQEGILKANSRPPACKDIALYKSDYMMYSNTETKERLSFSVIGGPRLGQVLTGDTTNTSDVITALATTENLEAGMSISGTGIPGSTTIVSVDSSSQITISNAATATGSGVSLTFITHRTLSIAGVSYSFASTETPSSGIIGVGLTGVSSVDIDTTARSLVRAINRYSSNTYADAFYQSGPDSLPGSILLEERGVGGSSFSIAVSNSFISTQFDFSNGSSSTDQQQKNAIYWSKPDQPEAVPVGNNFTVGASNREILRIAPLKDALIIVKEEGVWRMTGDTESSFVVTPLDTTVFCKAKESVVVLGNKVYMLSNQGVVSISENSVEVVSRDIEPDLLPLFQNMSLSSYVYGVSYESERSYYLSSISNKDESVANQVLVYNYFTRAWTRFTYPIACGVVEPTGDKLYFSKPSDSKIYLERKSFSDDDFADPETSITITAISGTTVSITSSVEPVLGDVIKQGTTGLATVQEIVSTSGGYDLVLEDEPPESWTTGSATLLPSVKMDIAWNQWSYAQPGTLKQVREVAILADDIEAYNTVSRLILNFKSNFDSDTEDVEVEQPGGGWGDSWGESPWGGEGDTFGYPTFVPRNKQYCTRLYVGVKHNNALERLSIAGLSFEFDLTSEEIGR